ncbi:guanylate-binding protein 1-like [Anolis sagrei]|uniref:guanylate-binding protein 1-like n=1 Tax=Anolis sagrei TaxID=38937 RepID=UPI0035200CF8
MSPGEAHMDHPLCLIENRPDGRLVLQEEALAVLRRIRQPVVVVAIVGPYRTGKSYLMNRLAGQRKGFSLGSTVQANTKGIWMWCRPHPHCSDRTLVLLDTEGLEDTGKSNTQNDAWIFALAILLSSTLVYNSKGTIDQNALDQLHYVTELTQKIRVTSSRDPSQEDEDSSEFARYFPAFIWAVRDFTLELEIDGHSVDDDGYLENALKLRKGNTEQVRRCNLPRLCIRKFFPSRKCFTFFWPTSKKKNLRQLEELQEEDLEEEFQYAVTRFCDHVWGTAKRKTVPGGQAVTGAMLAKLAETYVETICSGKVPCLESAVLALAEMENTAAVEEAVAHYGRLMGEKLILPTESVPELLGVHAECEKEALRVFMARAFKDDHSHFQTKLVKTLDDRKEGYCQRNEQESTQCCQALLASLSVELEEKVRNWVYFQPNGHQQFVDDLKDIEGRYRQKPKKGVMAEEALKQFLEGKEAVGRAILQKDTALSEKEKQMAEARAQAEATQREQEVQRQRQAELEQKMRDQQRSYEENVQQLKAKIEQNREQLLEEQKMMMENKLAEKEALLIEGYRKEAEQMIKEIQRLKEESAKIKDPSWPERALEGLVTGLSLFLPGIAGKAMGIITNMLRDM